MNKTQWLRKQIEALTQTFPRRSMLAARREPWERRCALLLCFCGAAVLGTAAGPCPAAGQAGTDGTITAAGGTASAPVWWGWSCSLGAETMLFGTRCCYRSHSYISCNTAGTVVMGRAGGEPFPGAPLCADPVASRLPAFWQHRSAEPPVPGEQLQGQCGGADSGWANSFLLTHEIRAGKFTSVHLQMLSF